MSFSIKQRSHRPDKLEYAGALLNISQLIWKLLPSRLSLQMYLDSSVRFSYLSCLKSIKWFAYRCLLIGLDLLRWRRPALLWVLICERICEKGPFRGRQRIPVLAKTAKKSTKYGFAFLYILTIFSLSPNFWRSFSFILHFFALERASWKHSPRFCLSRSRS